MKKLFTIALFLFYNVSFAAVYTVNNNSNAPIGHFSTIQLAISAAANGDTIYVLGSPIEYAACNVSKTITFIGAGYRPQKDVIHPSKVTGFEFQSTVGDGDGSKVLGFFITSRIGTIVSPSTNTCNNVEIAYNYFENSSQGIFLRNNCYVHDNIINVGSGSPTRIRFKGSNSRVENNIFNRFSPSFVLFHEDGGPHTGNIIGNNHFLSSSTGSAVVFGLVNNIHFLNNLLYNWSVTSDTSSTQIPSNCIFDNNVLYNFNASNNYILFGNNTSNTNINSVGIPAQFINPTANYAFDYPPNDFQLSSSSVGYQGGTDGTDVGAFGGANGFKSFTGMPQIPQIIKLDFINEIVSETDSLSFRVTGYANLGDTIIAAQYIFDSDLPGGGISLPIAPNDSFDLTYTVSHNSLSLGDHELGVRVMNANGVWSHLEVRTFTVCQLNGPIPAFDSYVSGYDVIFDNNSLHQDSCIWLFGDGNSSTWLDPVHHYDTSGVYNVSLVSRNSCDNLGDTLIKSVVVKGINTISPSAGGDIGVVTMTITGAGFADSTVVSLRDSTGANFIYALDSSTVVLNETVIIAAFDLKDAILGKWDVIVENTDTTFVRIEGFEIMDGISPNTRAEIVGPSFVRIQENTKYSVVIHNLGNVDAFSIPVWILTQGNVLMIPNFDIASPPDTLVQIDWDTIPQGFAFDTLFGITGNYYGLGYYIPIVSAGSSFKLDFDLHASSGGAFEIFALTGTNEIYSDSAQNRTSSSSSSCERNNDLAKCAAGTTGGLGGWIPGIGCAISASALLHQEALAAACAHVRKEKYDIVNGVWSTIFTIAGCVPPIDPVTFTIWFLGNGLATASGLGSCNDVFNGPIDQLSGNAVQSFDPNEKYGSTGAFNSPYLNSQSVLNYSVYFENVDTATVSAQTVIVIDTLDIAKLDLSTLQLTSFGFGDTIISIPPGRKSFTVNVDLQPNMPLVAQVSSFLNDSTGVLTTTFLSLDPITMEPTDSVLLGFLPPNDSTGRGEGFVNFSVRAQSTIQTGDTINNIANIFFDENASITTPIWTNIIDNLKPQSQVTTANQISNTDSINVTWTSSDNGPAGIYAHNVYYNINGGDWMLWKYNTSLNTDVFVGIMDSTYGFYSVAIDSALNIEDAPPAPDVTTTLSVGIEEIIQSHMIVKLFPNPSSTSVNISIQRFDKSKTDFNIIARDVTGRTISNEKVIITYDFKTTQIDISKFVSGVYLFEVTDGTNRNFKKLIKN